MSVHEVETKPTFGTNRGLRTIQWANAKRDNLTFKNRASYI
jgi:hypothetical protein